MSSTEKQLEHTEAPAAEQRQKSQPADTKPADTKPADTKPGDTKPGDKGEPDSHGGKPKRRPVLRAALIIGGIAALGAGADWLWHWWTHGRFVQSTNDAFLKADKVAVSARISGLVEQVLVKDNETVSAGQRLALLDDRDARAKLEQAAAQADQGRASIAEDEAQIRQQEAQIAQAQAQLEGSQSQLAFAEREAARYAKLAASGAETRESYDQKRQSRDQAHAQVARDTAAVLSAQRQIGMLQAQIVRAKAQIEQAQAQGRQAQVDLDAAVVTARIDGRVGDRTVQAGQYVQGGTRLMTIVPVQDLYLVANFKETQLRDMRVGQPATISVDALDGGEIRGTVESFAPGTGSEFALIPPQNATGNFTKIVQRVSVRIRLDVDASARKVLVPGLSVTAEVDTTSAADPDRAPPGPRPGDASAPARSAPSQEAVPQGAKP